VAHEGQVVGGGEAAGAAAEVEGRPVRPMGRADMGLLVTSQGSPSKERKEMESSPI